MNSQLTISFPVLPTIFIENSIKIYLLPLKWNTNSIQFSLLGIISKVLTFFSTMLAIYRILKLSRQLGLQWISIWNWTFPFAACMLICYIFCAGLGITSVQYRKDMSYQLWQEGKSLSATKKCSEEEYFGFFDPSQFGHRCHCRSLLLLQQILFAPARNLSRQFKSAPTYFTASNHKWFPFFI